MPKFVRILLFTLLAVVLLVLCAVGWAIATANARYSRSWNVHAADFPIPFPPTAADSAAAGPGGNADSVALQRAMERGAHLVTTRIGCTGCHGADLSGSVLIDVPVVGYYAAPNLTPGEGSVTKGFTAHEWDMAVRHGVRHNGRSSSMPCNELVNLSDHELSDIAAYVTHVPPVNKSLSPPRMGPVFSFLVATDPKMLAAYGIDHAAAHAAEPPPAAVTPEFGKHISLVCTGCHGPQFSGGKVAGDPNMPLVANLTPDPTGIKDWSEADFVNSIRTGKRPDGTAINVAMPWKTYAQMDDIELKAIYAYLRTVPARPKGMH
jgi:mono/diheme cytochrome c family protein